jgi:hypothetical protein
MPSGTSDGVMLYDDPSYQFIKEPANQWNDVKVVINKSQRPHVDDVHGDPQKYGATLIKIPLNETCWKNLFVVPIAHNEHRTADKERN